MYDGYGMVEDKPASSGPATRRARPNAGGMPDDELMSRIAAGDRGAAQMLMSRNLPRILGLARRMLNDEMEAEDVSQETFIRVWNAAPRWRPGQARVSTWMCRIAINLCHDRLRRRREIPTDAPPDRADAAPDQEAVMAQDETGGRIAAAMAQLPDRQRQALELVHFQEIGNIEAAEIMEISVEAMESLLARGRRKLRGLLIGDASDLMASYTGYGVAQNGVTQ
jgi:RNA polymerase sigma-70 factor (ECF subfamily)